MTTKHERVALHAMSRRYGVCREDRDVVCSYQQLTVSEISERMHAAGEVKVLSLPSPPRPKGGGRKKADLQIAPCQKAVRLVLGVWFLEPWSYWGSGFRDGRRQGVLRGSWPPGALRTSQSSGTAQEPSSA